MTKIDDMPRALANGVLTSCRSCGRMAIFAEPNKKSISKQDIWTCACLTENATPTRDSDVSARAMTAPRAFAEPHDPEGEQG